MKPEKHDDRPPASVLLAIMKPNDVRRAMGLSDVDYEQLRAEMLRLHGGPPKRFGVLGSTLLLGLVWALVIAVLIVLPLVLMMPSSC